MVRLRLARQLIALIVAGLAGFGGAGCVHVPRYERGAIARPDMTTSDIAGPAARHATLVREGATPTGAVAESGCGCN